MVLLETDRQRPFPGLRTDDKLGRELSEIEPNWDNKALDAEPPVASFRKSMLIGGGPVNAIVIPCSTMEPTCALPCDVRIPC